jgi:peptidoglycan/LPS O-acetylase OafA/YrhL
MEKGNNKRVFGLDIMRAAAILLVLLSHTVFILPIDEKDRFFILIFCGFVGVEIFFILSGYLVGGILLRDSEKSGLTFSKIKSFWIRRWFRTLPVYYLLLLTATVFYFYANRSFVFSHSYNFLYFIFFQNFFYPHPSFFRVAWSLSVEEFFYFIAPFIFFTSGLILRRDTTRIFSIIGWIAGITLLRIIVVRFFNPSWDSGVRMIVPLRLDSLMTGVLFAWLNKYFSESMNKFRFLFLAVGVIILIFSCWWLHEDVLKTDINAGFFSKTTLFNFFSFGFALSLPFFNAIAGGPDKYISGAVTHISRVSYSLYLTHPLSLYFFVAVCNKLHIISGTFARLSISWLFCLAVATVLYKFYEKPMMDMREKYS